MPTTKTTTDEDWERMQQEDESLPPPPDDIIDPQHPTPPMPDRPEREERDRDDGDIIDPQHPTPPMPDRPEREERDQATEFEVPEGAEVSERDVAGVPIAYETQAGAIVYAPEHIMFELGYKTREGYIQGQKGRRIVDDTGRVRYEFGAPYVAIDTYEGLKHITREQAQAVAGLTGKERFDKYVALDIIPRGSIYIDEETYLSAENVEALKTGNPVLYNVLVTGGVGEYQQYVDLAQQQRAQVVGWFKTEAPQELKDAYERGGLDEALKLYVEIRDRELQQFESNLRAESPELYEAYQVGGLDAYNALVRQLNQEYKGFRQQIESGEIIELPDGKYISKDDYEKQPEGVRQILSSSGMEGLESLGETNWIYNGETIGSGERDRIVQEYEAKRDTLIQEGKMFSPEWTALGEHPENKMVLTPESGKRLGIKTIAFIAPAAKSLLPEYTVKDVSAVEWGLTGVNVALLGAAFAPGALLSSVVGKWAIGGLSTAGAGLLGYQTTKHWKDFSPTEKSIAVGGTLLYALPVLSIPVRNIKITSTKIPTIEGEAVVWKGLSVFQNPVIGRSGGKWVVGSRNLTLPEAKLIIEGYKPEMMLDTKVFVNEEALAQAGFSKTQIDYLTLTLRNRNLFAGRKSPFLSEETLLDPTARLDADEVAVFLEQINKYRDKVNHVDMLFGSQTIKAQLAPELRGWRKTHDLDMHSTFNLDEAVAFTNETLNELKKLGGNRLYRISPKSPIRIEKMVKGKWEHMNDLKSEFIDPSLQSPEIQASQLDKTNAYSYGKLVEEPAITVEYPGVGKIDIMSLSESGVRKADTILRVRQTEMGTAMRPPERGIASPGVPKDAADFYVILRTFKGRELADEWAEAWANAMGYSASEAKKLLPQITRTMETVAAETPSNLIGYRYYPSKGGVIAEASPTINLHVPSTLGASVSGSLSSRISSPISPYAVASSIPSTYLPSISGMSATSMVIPSKPSAPVTPPSSPTTPPSTPLVPPSTPPATPLTPPSEPTTPPITPLIPPSTPLTPPIIPLTPPLTPPTVPTTPTPPLSPLTPPIELTEFGGEPKPSPKTPPPDADKGYEEQVSRITPGTVVWVQGRPTGGAMYKVLPPPYKQEDMFTMRALPPGYEDKGWTGEGSVRQSLQVIGGEPPEEVDVQLGWTDIKITREGGILDIDYDTNVEANVGLRAETIGMGEGQIPIEVWEQAKEQGLSIEEVKAGASKVEGGWFVATAEGDEGVVAVDYDTGDKELEDKGSKRLVPFERTMVGYDETILQGKSLVPETKRLVQEEDEEPNLERERPGIGSEMGFAPNEEVRYVYRDVTQPSGQSNMRGQAVAIVDSSGDDDDDDDDRKRLKKPKDMEDWWESPYYGSERRRASRIPERTYYGRRLLPPDLGGSL